MNDYTPTTDEVKNAYHWRRYYSDPRFRYSQGALLEFNRWLVRVERAAAERVWDEGYTRGFYDREKLSGDSRDASEGSTENPYRAEAYRRERGE